MSRRRYATPVERPDLNLLVALEVLLAEGSVASAARRLQLSASAMSRTLSRLRETTGDPLLVRAGTETSGTLFSTILENVQKTSELNGSIADANIEQNQGIRQITAAMNQLDQAAQVNAATAEELSATTLEINEVAINVRSLTEDLQKVVRGRI